VTHGAGIRVAQPVHEALATKDVAALFDRNGGFGSESVRVMGPVGWDKGSRQMVQIDRHSSVEREGGMAVSRAQVAQLVEVEIEIWFDIVWDDRAVNCRSDGGSCLKRDWAGKLRESGMR
jgi:hypothetical protein